jgi:hypothetical protein
MPVDGSTTDDAGPPGSRTPLLAVLPIAFLLAIWLWLAFSHGGYLAGHWLVPVLVLASFGLVVAVLIAYPRRPRQLSLAVLGLLGAYSVWAASSAIWAASSGRVWLESGRTFAYLLVLALALVYFTATSARTAFLYLLPAAALLLLAVCVWRLWATSDLSGLFVSNRLTYPASDPNKAAAMFLVSFWPLMWLASGPSERAPVRGLALGLATGLLALAVLTQSRGAMWSMAIAMVLMFLLSPARLRLLFYLLVPALLLAYAFPQLNKYWVQGPEALTGAPAARVLTVAVITAAFIGMILSLLETWVRVSRRMKAIFGAVILVACVAALVYGAVTLTRDEGGPFGWMSQTWHQFTTDSAKQGTMTSNQAGRSRFAELSSAGRVGIWKVAWREFEGSPWLGVGVDNFSLQYDRLRADASYAGEPRQAHSITLQVLGDTGIVGGVLAFGGILVAVIGILWPRFASGWTRARQSWLRTRGERRATRAHLPGGRGDDSRWGADPIVYGWEMALFVGAAYWFVHANVEWLWQVAGASVPALLMLAAALASIDARAGTMWPRIARWLPQKPAAAADAVPEKRRGDLLRPPGPVSRIFRIALIVLSAAVLVLAGLAFVSTRIQSSALALSPTDPQAAAERAASARWFAPGDASPYVTQASIYARAARDALASPRQDRAGAVLDDLALAIAAHEKAIAREPVDWTSYYRAAWSTLDLVAAKAYAEGRGSDLQAADTTASFIDQHDWSGLAGTGTVPAVGAAAGSLAEGHAQVRAAKERRDLTQRRLLKLASGFIAAADERNPLEQAIDETILLIRKLPTY